MGNTAAIDAFVAQYKGVRPRYKSLAKEICRIVSEFCEKDLIQTTEYRAKNLDSFREKCEKETSPGNYKYDDPLLQLTDLAGVRAIVYLRDSVEPVCAAIRHKLHVIEEIDVGERVYSEGKFGYQSKHMIVMLGDDRSSLEENEHVSGLVCEIQVRTLLQHAWAAIDHKIQYKKGSEIPLEIRKRFSALAGALELADRELQRIDDDTQEIRTEIQSGLEMDLTQRSLDAAASTTKTGSGEPNKFLAIRSLIRNGSYSEAIEAYSERLSHEPQSFTLLLGRAKAKFLIGDTTGAFEDLDRFDAATPNDARVQRLRQIFESGDPRELGHSMIIGSKAEYAQGYKRAMDALNTGNGVLAFEEYATLESNGFNKAFCYFGMALACALEGDQAGARNFSSHLGLIPGKPMAVNKIALETMLSAAEGQDIAPLVEKLRQALSEFPVYSLQNSPMASFLEGWDARKNQPPAGAVKSILENPVLHA